MIFMIFLNLKYYTSLKICRATPLNSTPKNFKRMGWAGVINKIISNGKINNERYYKEKNGG
jgi:hypothetical protein